MELHALIASLATYVRLKLQGVHGLILLPEKSPHVNDRAVKDDQTILCIMSALLGSSTLFYLTKHDRRGGR